MKRCPFCGSNDIIYWEERKSNYGFIQKVYRCSNCSQFLYEQVKDDNNFGDNYPQIPYYGKPKEMDEHKKFKHLKKITRDEIVNYLIDLWEYEQKLKKDRKKKNK